VLKVKKLNLQLPHSNRITFLKGSYSPNASSKCIKLTYPYLHGLWTPF